MGNFQDPDHWRFQHEYAEGHTNDSPVDLSGREGAPKMGDDDDFDLTVTIGVSLDEAETIQATLAEASEDHLAEHVKWCIEDAKKNAGYLQPARDEK